MSILWTSDLHLGHITQTIQTFQDTLRTGSKMLVYCFMGTPMVQSGSMTATRCMSGWMRGGAWLSWRMYKFSCRALTRLCDRGIFYPRSIVQRLGGQLCHPWW